MLFSFSGYKQGNRANLRVNNYYGYNFLKKLGHFDNFRNPLSFYDQL